ncbi:histone-lysine N-methyltransferase, H3 lysine-9 specific SUVH6-like [Panicum virgatum]|uniref:Histone-lysine N-methyltransferase, H3 lysine-9 specific SUVH5 n=1 Tax=Panicum virgatum TaxID=38727 RepID=A0A8T0RDZ7_PANVG|nr:histone-lysine N-methyltransferase, H3 lysine-9 specific SUVH6-like [Panicum virgatum]KAG2583694.1 hypothetical protein PVAP13_6KG193312 [Panicum virgatum]
MDSYAARPLDDNAARPRPSPLADGLPPPRWPPAPRPRGGGDARRGGGLAERGVAAPGAAAASGGNAAGVAGELVGEAAAGVAASGVAREEEMGGGAEAGTKRRLPLAPARPPPKRTAVSARRQFPSGCGRLATASLAGAGAGAGSRSGDAGARSCSGVLESKDGALLGAATHSATCSSALEKVSAAVADGPVPGCGHHVPEAGAVKSSSEALRRGDVAAPDGSLDIGSQGVPAVSVEGRGNGAGSGELRRKELVPAAPLQAESMVSFAKRSSPLGCGRDAVLSVLVGGGIGLESGAADGDLSVAEIVPSQPNGTIDGTVQDGGLEEGEIAPEVVVQESQVSTGDTLQNSSACTHGPSTDFRAAETSAMQPSNEKTDGNTLPCEKKGSSWLVAKDVEVMNQSIGSSSNIVAESLAADSSKQNMIGKRVSNSARMKIMHTSPRLAKNLHKEETEQGRPDRIKDTAELTTDQVMQAHTSSSDKFLMTQEKEAATSRGFFGPRKKVKVKTPAHLRMKIASARALGSKGKLNDEVASNLDDDDILKALVVHEGKLELYLKNSSGLTSARCQQHGSQNADARSKFKMLCRRFEFVCRALVQAVEQRSLKIRRIDLEADKVIRNLPGFIKHDAIVGQVPGVEVGDEFLYRVQLAIVGLHRVYQGGIDTTTHRNGERIAISIVASVGYPDELPCSGELIYTGSGGKPARKNYVEDQKLEGGNLALKNCIKTKTPVRVIYGFKRQNTEGGSHSRAKQISTFTYDGLYRVVDFWMHGRPGSRVFKYKLRKIPGQSELPMHIAKGVRKSKTRPGLCMVDISQGKEGTPICVINTVDDVQPTPFRYITRIKYPSGLTKIRQHGCDCTNGCSDSASCACAVKNGGEIPFNSNGAIVNEKPLIFECGPSCKCPPSCQNRVSQHGMKIPLEVFRTTKTGWGVRSLRSITSGSFICEHVGELYGKEADKRRNSDYLFDVGLNCGDGLLSTVSGPNTSSSCSGIMEDVGFTVDAAEYGNIGRFINHSCSPNLYAQNVIWDHDDKRVPHIMFFAAETIPPLQELTYDYNYEIDHVQEANGRIKFKVCQCGSPQCSGRLY